MKECDSVNSMRLLKNTLSIGKRELSKIRGASYIEFFVTFLIITLVAYTIIQIYWLINAQILVMNTARSALRQLEVYGEVPSNLKTDVENELRKFKNITKVEIRVNDAPIVVGKKYQLRTPIKLKLTADYNLFLFDDALIRKLTTITLSATYQGSSQRLHKDLPFDDNLFVTE